MKKIVLLLAAALSLALTSCSSSSTSSFTLSSGNYAPSGGTATSAFATDQCNVVSFFAAGSDPIPVVVASDGLSATFNFSSTDDAAHKETVSITGNAIAGTASANYTKVWTSTCTSIFKVQVVSGELTANDDMHLVVQYDISNAVGSICTPADVDAKALPCTSQVDFLAKK